MPVEQWIHVLLIGSMAGAVGQLVRAIAGLAKAGRVQGGSTEPFNSSQLVISLLVGATAGALAGIAMSGQFGVGKSVTTETILGLMGAGYAGTDFIEAFAGKYFNAVPTTAMPAAKPQNPEPAAVGTQPAAPRVPPTAVPPAPQPIPAAPAEPPAVG